MRCPQRGLGRDVLELGDRQGVRGREDDVVELARAREQRVEVLLYARAGQVAAYTRELCRRVRRFDGRDGGVGALLR